MRLDSSTWIPLGTVLAIVLLIVACIRWLDANFAEIKTNQRLTDAKVQSIIDDSNKHWTRHDMALWVESLGRLNTSIQLPKVETIGR